MTNGRYWLNASFTALFVLGWAYVALRAINTFGVIRTHHRLVRAEALAVVRYCSETSSDLRTYADCAGARAEIERPSGVWRAMDETAQALAEEAYSSLMRRSREAALTLGMTGAAVVGVLGLLAIAFERVVSGYMMRRALMNQFDMYSQQARLSGHTGVQIPILPAPLMKPNVHLD